MIAGDLLEVITDEAYVERLGQEVGRASVEMGVEAVLIMRRGGYEVVGHANHCREFEPIHGVEIGVAESAINRAVPQPKIGEPSGIVVTNRDVASP